jgi:hypothetical protein
VSIVFHRAFPFVMAAMASLSGCADGTRGTEPISRTPTQPLVAGVRGTVDGVAGTLTFEPLPPAHTSGAPSAWRGSTATRASRFGSTTRR